MTVFSYKLYIKYAILTMMTKLPIIGFRNKLFLFFFFHLSLVASASAGTCVRLRVPPRVCAFVGVEEMDYLRT